jgi:hypothetical protein
MPVFAAATLTLAEIAAAEALAATVAAEAAAVTAAEIAAAEAATAAAQAVATEAATAAAAAETATAATTAATEAATLAPEATGILEAGASAVPPPATPPTPAGLEQVASAPPAPAGATPPPPAPPAGAPPSPAGLEQVASPAVDPTYGFSPEELNAIQEGQNLAAQSGASPYAPTASTGQTPLVNASGPSPTSMTQSELAQMTTAETGIAPNQPLATTPPGTPPPEPLGPSNLISEPPTNPFLDGLKSVGSYMDANPIKTSIGLYSGANALGMFNSKGSGAPPEKKKYPNPNPLSADFNRNAQPTPNVYKPMTYQEGGITQAYQQNNDVEGGINGDDVPRYYRGELATSRRQKGDVYGATQRFLDMYDPAAKYTPPPAMPDVGIFRDSNPSTSSKSALEAADIRRKAIENRAYVKTGANYIPPSREMGELDFTIIGSKDKKKRSSESDSVLAARGGIMQANLGSYAAGGNPRLLRGPGDGMSDNIPAMIGNKQPARLADGEFVVPADVVSHLGNGSTEAGAKRLHEMMNQVRMDRTGKKKQAPAVKAKKYIPK